MTRRTLRLVPKLDNVVDLHEYRKGVVRHKTGRLDRSFSDDTTQPRLPVAAGADDPRQDAWPYPCDMEPGPAA